MTRRLRVEVTLDPDGRRTPIQPRAGTYRPHFIPEGSSSRLGVQFVSGPEFLAPGQAGEVDVDCIFDIAYDELRPGVRFVIAEGPHRIGTGAVLDPSRPAVPSR